jgi:hypothetical protein
VLFWRPYAIATVDLFSSYFAFNLSFVLIMLWKPWVGKDSFYWILIAFFLSWNLHLETPIGTAPNDRLPFCLKFDTKFCIVEK